MSVQMADAARLRALVGFEDLIEPVSRAFQDFSAGLAQCAIVITATLLNNGKVLVAGGFDLNGHVLATAEVFRSNSWILRADGEHDYSALMAHSHATQRRQSASYGWS